MLLEVAVVEGRRYVCLIALSFWVVIRRLEDVVRALQMAKLRGEC